MVALADALPVLLALVSSCGGDRLSWSEIKEMQDSGLISFGSHGMDAALCRLAQDVPIQPPAGSAGYHQARLIFFEQVGVNVCCEPELEADNEAAQRAR